MGKAMILGPRNELSFGYAHASGSHGHKLPTKPTQNLRKTFPKPSQHLPNTFPKPTQNNLPKTYPSENQAHQATSLQVGSAGVAKRKQF